MNWFDKKYYNNFTNGIPTLIYPESNKTNSTLPLIPDLDVNLPNSWVNAISNFTYAIDMNIIIP